MRVQNSAEKIKRFLSQLLIQLELAKTKEKSGFVLTLLLPLICTVGYRHLLS